MTSPVITALELNPRRVRNIFICSLVVFCASSRITNESFSVRPRMKASGATSMMSFLQKALELVRFEQIVQRVVERTHVRIHFFLQRAGKKTQPLARFHRRTRQDDAVHLLRKQRGDRHRDGQIRLSRSAGTDGENHVVGFQRFHVAPLVGALGSDGFLAERTRMRGENAPREEVPACSPVAPVAMRSSDFTSWLSGMRPSRMRWLYSPRMRAARSTCAAAPSISRSWSLQMRGDVQGGLEEFQVFVKGAEKFVDAPCDSDGLFHQVSR